MANIEDIEGIGKVQGDKLREHGIRTVEALLEAGASASGREKIAEGTGISVKIILEAVNLADLMRINGIGSEFADLLEEAGVDTVKELATRVPANLAKKVAEINEVKKLTRRTPSLAECEKWVAEAKTLPPLVTY